MLIVLDNLQRKTWCVGVENVAQFSPSFIHGGRRKAGVELTRNREHSVRGSRFVIPAKAGNLGDGKEAAAQAFGGLGAAGMERDIHRRVLFSSGPCCLLL